jgi:hypothetical protein
MTIRTHRTWLLWSPLVGWALLSCGVSAVHAQGPTQSDVDPSTVTPSVPAGGAAPIIVTPDASPDDSFRRDRIRRGEAGTGTTLPEPTLMRPDVPSAGTTIVNSPFGTSVPYYGGITSVVSDLVLAGGNAPPADAIGISLGGFTLVPQIELNIGVDNNVFAQSAAAGPVTSTYAAVTPSFDLRSEWLNHTLHVLASGTLGWYGTAPTQNYQNYGIVVDGKVDIRNDMYVTGLVGFRRSTEALGTPNVVSAQAPTVVDTLPIEIGFYQQFNRVFYQISARATRYWYYDYSVISTLGLPAGSRDRFEFGESLRIGYQLFEDVDVFVAGSMNQIRYMETINTFGQARASDGANVSIGATWRINPISIMEANVGYQSSNLDAGGGATSAMSFGLAGTWTGYAPLTLRPFITRSINQSALTNYQNYVSTTFAVDFNYLIHDAWTLSGGLMYSIADYTPFNPATTSPRTDTFFRGQLGLLYSIKPEVQIGPFFEYSKGSSTDITGPSYDRQIYSIRLIARR